MGRRIPLIFMLAISFLLPVAEGWAAARNFKPKITFSYGQIELTAEHIAQEREQSGSETKSDETEFRELLEVGLTGFVYHPRLLSFSAGGSIGLNQLKTDSTSSNSSIEEYDLSATFLPSHPYNLQLYTRQSRPLLTSGYSNTSIQKNNTYGTIANYNKRRWRNKVSYEHTDISGTSPRITETFRASTNYSNSYSSVGLIHRTSDNTTISNQVKRSYTNFHHDIFKNDTVELNSLITLEDNDGSLDTETNTTWEERLTISLPHNLSSKLSFRRWRRKNSFTLNNSTTENYENSDLYDFELIHQLYDSLTTTFSSDINDVEASSGARRLTRTSILFDYTKLIPVGELTAGISAEKTAEDRNKPDSQQSVTITEEHFAERWEEFELLNQGINASTIVAYVIDDNLDARLMTEGIHYTVKLISSNILTYEIEIISNLSLIFPPTTGPVYTIRVTYDVLPIDYVLDTDEMKYSLELAMFGNFITPYISYKRKNQEVTEGFFPAGNLQPRIEESIMGIRLNQYGLSVNSEYGEIKADLDSEERITNSANYIKEHYFTKRNQAFVDLTGTHTRFIHKKRGGLESPWPSEKEFIALTGTITNFPRFNGNLYCTVGYSSRRNIQEASEFVETPDLGVIVTQRAGDVYSEDIITGSVLYRLNIPESNLRAEIETRYRRNRSLNESETYTLKGDLKWTFGTTVVEMNAEYEDETEKAPGGTESNSNDTRIYINIVRRLF